MRFIYALPSGGGISRNGRGRILTADIEAKDLPAHVAACSVRYRGIDARLKRIEHLIWGWIVLIGGGGAWVISKLVEIVERLGKSIMTLPPGI